MGQKGQNSISRRQVLAAGTALAAIAGALPVRAQSNDAGSQHVVIITGTSSGFGRLMTETFARGGLRVVATMRDVEGRNAIPAGEIRELARRESLPIDVVDIDVRDDASVRSGVAEALRLAGRVDVLVNNAGIVVPGPVGLQPVDAFAANLNTNCHGALRMFRAVAPHMRERGEGQVIQMSSALGRLLDPLLAGYCASKLAVEAACDAIAYEQSISGIEVSIIQPAGPYPTRLQANGLRNFEEMLAGLPESIRQGHADYARHLTLTREGLVPDSTLSPQEIADAAMSLIALRRGTRPRRIVVGPYKDGITRLNSEHEAVQADMVAGSGLEGFTILR